MSTGAGFHLQLLHGVRRVGGIRLGAGRRVPQVQRSPPQTHLHVPGAPAVLPVLVRSGGVELRIPQVSEEEERNQRGVSASTFEEPSSDSLRHAPSSYLGTCWM